MQDSPPLLRACGNRVTVALEKRRLYQTRSELEAHLDLKLHHDLTARVRAGDTWSVEPSRYEALCPLPEPEQLMPRVSHAPHLAASHAHGNWDFAT